MKIGILGSGNVAQALSSELIKNNHDVMLGTRDVKKLEEFTRKNPKVKTGSFEKTANFGELIFLCTQGIFTLNVLDLAGKDNFKNKVIIDVTNPLDFSQGDTPVIAPPYIYPNSLGSAIQNAIPNAKIVKAFNTVPANLMVNPILQEGSPTFLMCGNDSAAKEKVTEIARKFGWKDIIDIGDIRQSSLLESLTILWVTYGIKNNYWSHAFKLLRK